MMQTNTLIYKAWTLSTNIVLVASCGFLTMPFIFIGDADFYMIDIGSAIFTDAAPVSYYSICGLMFLLSIASLVTLFKYPKACYAYSAILALIAISPILLTVEIETMFEYIKMMFMSTLTCVLVGLNGIRMSIKNAQQNNSNVEPDKPAPLI